MMRAPNKIPKKILNGREKIPDEFYVFVENLSPPIANEFNITKRLTSASFSSFTNSDFLPKYMDGSATYCTLQPSSADCQAISDYSMKLTSNYKVEYDAENYRLTRHCLFPSRLSGIFAFGDYNSCVTASHKYGFKMDSLKRFVLVPNPLNRVAKVNMRIFALAKTAYLTGNLDKESMLYIWSNYWGGTGNLKIDLPVKGAHRRIYDSGVIYEYIIDGVIEETSPKYYNI